MEKDKQGKNKTEEKKAKENVQDSWFKVSSTSNAAASTC